jgi:hypothetical protein
MGLRIHKPNKTAKGKTTRGTMATGHEIMAITAMKKIANGVSAKMNKDDEVKKLRTASK